MQSATRLRIAKGKVSRGKINMKIKNDDVKTQPITSCFLRNFILLLPRKEIIHVYPRKAKVIVR